MAGSESESRTKRPRIAGAEGPGWGSGAPRPRSPQRGSGRRGVARRIAELGGDRLLELRGEDGLEHLGLRVDAIPRHLEDLRQEELEQAVVADDLEGRAAAFGCKAQPR